MPVQAAGKGATQPWDDRGTAERETNANSVATIEDVITEHWAHLMPEDPFPPGDGTADTEATVVCPYCAQVVEIGLDPGSGPTQEYVEDCEVCCRPWQIKVSYHEDGSATVLVEGADAD